MNRNETLLGLFRSLKLKSSSLLWLNLYQAQEKYYYLTYTKVHQLIKKRNDIFIGSRNYQHAERDLPAVLPPLLSLWVPVKPEM